MNRNKRSHNVIDRSVDDGLKFVSIGRIRQDIIDSIIEKYPEFTDILSADTEILFGKTVSNIRKDIEKILYLMKNMNCVLSRYLLSYRIQNLSASIQIKTVFLLFVGSPITYLLPCAYPQMDD